MSKKSYALFKNYLHVSRKRLKNKKKLQIMNTSFVKKDNKKSFNWQKIKTSYSILSETKIEQPTAFLQSHFYNPE